MPRLPLLLLAALVPMALQALALLNPDVPVIDCEERYNAGHAWMLLQGHLDALFRLQYRPFCGGCTLTAGLGALAMGLLGPSFAAWKGVALAFTGLAGAVGAAGLWRRENGLAAFIFVALLSLAPLSFIRLMLLSWGNHLECGVIALPMLVLATGTLTVRRARLLGLLGGFGLWVGFSMAVPVAAVALYLALRDRRMLLPLAQGLALAPILWLLQRLLGGPIPFGTIYNPGEFLPDPRRLPRQLAGLLAPAQVAGLFGLPRLELGLPLGYGFLASLLGASALGWRQGGIARLATLCLLTWLGAYLLLGFELHQPGWPEVPAASGLRYVAPAWLFGLFVLSSCVGRVASGAHKARLLLLAVPMLTGLLARAATLTAPFPSAAASRFEAADWDHFRGQAVYLLEAGEHRDCVAQDPRSEALHAYALGRRGAQSRLERGEAMAGLVAPPDQVRAFGEGVGGGLIDHLDPDSEGSLRRLQTVAEALAPLDPAVQEAALAEAAWRRVYRQSRFSLGRGGFQAADLGRQRTLLRSVSRPLAEAWLVAWGRRLGKVEGRWAAPAALVLPTLEPKGLGPFARGLGAGLAEEWGPQDRLPLPVGLAPSLHAELQAGYSLGLRRDWLPALAADSPVDAAVWEADPAPYAAAALDRWWGPPPPMLCPCGATCE